MSEAERHEFIVTANVSDGDWDLERLLEQYDTSMLSDLGLEKLVASLPSTDFDDMSKYFDDKETSPDMPEDKKKTIICPKCGETIEI